MMEGSQREVAPATREERRATRADAVRNRELAFAAAKACFAEEGADTSMPAIAKKAGVGVATLYRAFGSRSGLAEAVFHDMLDELAKAATCPRTGEDAWAALTAWLQSYVEQMIAKWSMISELQPLFDRNPTLLPDSRMVAAAALSSVLEPAQKAGLARKDVSAADLIRLLNGTVIPGAAPPQRANVLLDIIVSGLKA